MCIAKYSKVQQSTAVSAKIDDHVDGKKFSIFLIHVPAIQKKSNIKNDRKEKRVNQTAPLYSSSQFSVVSETSEFS